MLTKYHNNYLMSVVVLLFCLLLNNCGGEGGEGGSGGTEASHSPVLLSVMPSQDSAIATSMLDSFQLDFEFSDTGRDLDGGTLYMDWGGDIRYTQLDTSFSDIQNGNGHISFSLFYIPPIVGDVTVKCWLTDKAGNKSSQTSFLFTQTKPNWPWQWGSGGTDNGVGVAVNSEDSIFILGEYSSVKFLAKYLPDAFCNDLLQLDMQRIKAVTVDTDNNIYTTGEITAFADVSITKYDNAGNQIWEKTLSSSETDLAGGVAVDRVGNVYVTGGTWGDLDGNVNAGSGWGYDVILAKYDSSGNKQWTRQFGSPEIEYGSGVAIDSANNVYVVGGTGGELDGQSNPGNSDSTFLVKYDSSGNKLWTRLFGSVLNYMGSCIVIDSSDNIYVAGSTGSELNDEAAVGFVSKYNTSGDLQWIRLLGGQSWYAECFAIALDHNGDIVITGTAYGDTNSDTPTALSDAFVAKYDSSGTQIWFTLLSTPSYDNGNAIAVDSNNYIYVTGTTKGSLPGYTNGGDDDIFIAKFDTNGILQH